MSILLIIDQHGVKLKVLAARLGGAVLSRNRKWDGAAENGDSGRGKRA